MSGTETRDMNDGTVQINDKNLDEATKLGLTSYEKNCASCHNPILRSRIRGTTFEAVKESMVIVEDMSRIKSLLELDDKELKSIVSSLNRNDLACRPPDQIANVELRRLSNSELSRTIETLLGIKVAAKNLPVESRGKFFLNTSDTQSITGNSLFKIYQNLEIAVEKFLKPGHSHPTKKHILSCYRKPALTAACAEEAIYKFAPVALRGTAPDRSKVIYQSLQKDLSPILTLKAGLISILLDPGFLYHVEISSVDRMSGGQYKLSEIELASRLSYFLWGTMPDKILLDLANKNMLRNQLGIEVKRMLSNSKSSFLVENFGGAILQLYKLEDQDSPLKETVSISARQETELLFKQFMQESVDFTGIFGANFSFLNVELAKHYGIEGNFTKEFRKTQLSKESKRQGVLTHASVMTASADGVEFAPIKRGAWIFDNIICGELPDTPPNIEPITKKKGSAKTRRESLHELTDSPTCAVCHNVLEPLGFAFEGFGPSGIIRDTYSDAEVIDTSGKTKDGMKVSDHLDIIKYLDNNEKVEKCMLTHLYSFATGKDATLEDTCEIQRLHAGAKKNGFSFEDLIIAIVQSDSFNYRLD